MSDNKDNHAVKRNTCLRALDKLLLCLKEGQWIFVPKNEEEATALNGLCTAVDISFDDLTTICHYLKLMQTKSAAERSNSKFLWRSGSISKDNSLMCLVTTTTLLFRKLRAFSMTKGNQILSFSVEVVLNVKATQFLYGLTALLLEESFTPRSNHSPQAMLGQNKDPTPKKRSN
jgi:hypothetical protein